MKQWKLATVIAAGLVVLGVSVPARAQAPVSVGYVDMERAFDGADAKKSGEDKVNNLARTLQERERLLQDAKLLPSATWQQYKTLLEKDKRTPDDEKALTGIQDQLTKLDAELKSLQQPVGGQLTDVQRARLNELNGNGTTNMGNLQDIDRDYGDQVAKLQTDLRNGIVANIQKAAQQVAKTRNVGVVLNKQIAVGDDSQLLVIAGGVDLTDDVIKQVNGK